ncbi:MarR family transcriptional regulator [Sphingomonas sp. S1-29]|uniref:MarR family transcriptional regulator n=1 Tax=Sphingomonas sp. S1-29 TaxID=2991074 RepID=UPI00224032A5|nr:MarR family transcriptional regulator [Sphingomonas sp. S1-29]UZK68941.1 MarR family transcriptional regulator [Sphingomonas sp. S1-29]
MMQHLPIIRIPYRDPLDRRDDARATRSVPKEPARNINDRSKATASVDLTVLARQLYDFGQRRSKFFPADLFGEPAWYILLDLYASAGEGRAISVTSASVASGAPTTTGLRMVRVLEDKGLVCRGQVQTDRRRSDVRLTPAGRDAVEQALRELRPMLGQVLHCPLSL